MHQFNAENLHLSQVEVVEFSLSTRKMEVSERQTTNLEFSHDIYSGIDVKHNRIGLGLKLNGKLLLNEEADVPHFFIDLLFHFQYDKLSDCITKDEEGQFALSAAFGEVLASISYSTARGIVFERTLNTVFDGLVLPIVKPSGLL